MTSPLFSSVLEIKAQLNLLQSDLQRELRGIPKSSRFVSRFIHDVFAEKNKQLTSQEWKYEVSYLKNELKHLGVSDVRLNEIERRIVEIQQAILAIPQSSGLTQPAVPLVFLCDIDGQDFNGAMFEDIRGCMIAEIPFITTQRIFTGSARKPENDDADLSMEELYKINEKFDIFLRGLFYIFIPKSFALERAPHNKLELFDIGNEEAHLVGLGDLLSIKEGKPTMDGFIDMFSQAKHDKFVSICGHGGLNSVAGLSVENYQAFLALMERQRCKGLMVMSCYAAGSTSMLHLTSSDADRVYPAVTFPVILHSIGDFTTNMNIESYGEGDLFLKLPQLLDAPGGRTTKKVRKLLETEEVGIDRKHATNLMRVYFPHRGDVPGGFSSVGEGKKTFSLTYANYRKYQLNGNIPERPQSDQMRRRVVNTIVVSGKDYIEVAPIVITSPVLIAGKKAIVLSMIPDKSFHVFTDVTLERMSPKEFLAQNVVFYEKYEAQTNKTLFIGTLKSEVDEIRQVYINLKMGECGYRERGQYYYQNMTSLADRVPLTSFQYALRWQTQIHISTPYEEAVGVSTGGQQSLEEALDVLNGEQFWMDDQQTYNRYEPVVNKQKCKRLSLAQLKILIAEWGLSEKEIVDLLSYLMSHNKQLAKGLFEKMNIPPDSVDSWGIPLIINAAQRDCNDLMRLLIERGANINVQTPKKKNSCLAIALSRKNHEVANLLLDQDSIDVNIRDNEGIPAFAYAIQNEVLLDRCVEKRGTTLNFEAENETHHSVLGRFIEIDDVDEVESILDMGADPNRLSKGQLPLEVAIEQGDPEMISLLLKRGANPHLKRKNVSPLDRAMMHSPASVVEKMIQIEDENLGKREYIRKIFFSSLLSADPEKIWVTIRKMESFLINDPSLRLRLDQFNHEEKQIVRKAFYKLVLRNENDVLNQFADFGLWDLKEIILYACDLFHNQHEWCGQIAGKALELGLDANVTLSALLNRRDLIMPPVRQHVVKVIVENGGNLNTPDGRYATVFALLCTQTPVEFIEWCLAHGAEVNPENPQGKLLPLQAAVLLSTHLVEVLIKSGADILRGNASHDSPLLLIIAMGDLQLIRLCLEGKPQIVDKMTIENMFLCAYQTNQLEVVKLLESYGYRFSFEGKTLEEAAKIIAKSYEKNKSSGVAILNKQIESGATIASVQIAAPNLLIRAIESDDLKMLEFLQQKGISFDPTAIFMRIDFDRIWLTDKFEVLIKILELMDPMQRIEKLNICVRRFFFSCNMVKYALANGVDPNISIDETTEKAIIFEAIYMNRVDLVQAILSARPDLNLKFEGFSPLAYAEERGFSSIQKMLKAENSS